MAGRGRDGEVGGRIGAIGYTFSSSVDEHSKQNRTKATVKAGGGGGQRKKRWLTPQSVCISKVSQTCSMKAQSLVHEDWTTATDVEVSM